PTVKININNITTVKKTNDPTASAAPTIFGRIKITEINNTVIIAPKDFDELKTELLTINPTISFKE
ncbi:MAG: PH domain-containing protein, partial [Chryseobacterium sp.]|nr:PH domain-containing protein [Candidatus Chryseobacterium enterohippi]